MSNLAQHFADRENKRQKLKRNHEIFDAWHANYEKNEELLQGMESQVESKDWEDLKND